MGSVVPVDRGCASFFVQISTTGFLIDQRFSELTIFEQVTPSLVFSGNGSGEHFKYQEGIPKGTAQ